jgi:hypothetical protein
MQAVTFTFRADVPPDVQDAVLQQIGAWPEIASVGRIDPSAELALLRRMAYAYAKDDAAAPQLAQRLSALPEIEAAELPAPRRLV